MKAYEEREEVTKYIFIIYAVGTGKLSTPQFGLLAIPCPLDRRQGGPRRRTGQIMRGQKFLPLYK
jgi:hypothetical protein